MQKKPKAKQDEIELAKSVFDEIVEETESKDWGKEKPQKKSAANLINSSNKTSKPLKQIEEVN